MAYRILCFFLYLSSTWVFSATLLETENSWDGGKIVYPEGDPLVTSIVLNVPEGKVSPWHCHPMPTLGYIAEGTVEVETVTGKRILLQAGESAVEAMRTLHRAKAHKGDAKIIVFYAGVKGMPTTVLPKDDPHHHYCNPANP